MTSPSAPAPSRRLSALAIPLVIFAAIVVMFAFALTRGDPSKLPSALIGKPVPAMALPPLEGLADGGRALAGFDPARLGGQVAVVNFWASWCGPCVEEHPQLMALQQSGGVAIYGINHKDAAVNARRFLGRYGNPYTAVGVDQTGRAAIEWGVYGMPETFVIDGQGRIAYKHVGPITAETLRSAILPAIAAARGARTSQAR